MLIDSSNTHSFITLGIIERLELKLTFVDIICIKMSNGDKIPSNQMLLGETVTLKSKEMIVDLIVFEMLDFDVILGMNFLSCYGVAINCRKKKV